MAGITSKFQNYLFLLKTRECLILIAESYMQVHITVVLQIKIQGTVK